MRKLLLTTALISSFAAPAFAAEQDLPSREEMWKMIQAQQSQISSLENMVKSTDEKVEATTAAVEDTAEKVASIEPASGGGFSNGWWERTSIHGYGELHLNKGSVDDEIDFHRFVIGINHDFNERMRLVTEIELEHSIAGDGQVGEVELEQAYVEYDLNDYNKAKAGVFLIPVGILNETHEPTTFFGTERNRVENQIIPSTWWEGGVAVNGELGDGFSYDVAAHSGLNTEIGNIRSGREKVGQASAEDGAITGRLKWTGYPGVELAVSAQHQQDLAQGALGESHAANLVEAHAVVNIDGFGLRALYAQWDIDGAAVEANGRDEQYGFYIEPSYTFDVTEEDRLGFFARYSEHDVAAGDAIDSEEQNYDFGMNYWPHEDVVLKADVTIRETDTVSDEIFNLGLGFTY